MRVTVEGSLWVAIGSIVAGQVPDDQSLVARARKEHVWAKRGQQQLMHTKLRDHSLFERGCQTGDPAGVALKGTAVDELLSHDCGMIEDGNGELSVHRKILDLVGIRSHEFDVTSSVDFVC